MRILTAAAAKASDDTWRRQRRTMAALSEQGKKTSGPRYFGMPGTWMGIAATPQLVEAERDAIAWGVRTVRGNLWQARRASSRSAAKDLRRGTRWG